MTEIRIRFFQPHPSLLPYISTYYLTEVDALPGGQVSDYLHPEWANLRFMYGEQPLAAIGSTALQSTHAFNVTGPTSKSCLFAVSKMRAWGIGLLPLGWTRFVGAPAELYADRFVDGAADPVFQRLSPLAAMLTRNVADPDEQVAGIDAHLTGLLSSPPDKEDERRVDVAHKALLDSDVFTVSHFSDRVGMSPRSVERLCRRAFGFTPKLLLRRQRFLRSLSQFMLDPSMRWINTLDCHYHDQAHFARDFSRFMGMSARQYARLEHPILGAAAFARMAAAGAAMQALHIPND
ncbi:MAG: helix-turn-helix domain-containing protein [Sphingorhabdus sp.]